MSSKIFRLVEQALKEVFRRPAYIILTVILALTFFLASIWLPRYKLLSYIFSSDTFDLGVKIKTLWLLVVSLDRTFTTASVILVVILSVLAAFNITMMVFYFKRRVVLQREAGASIFGIIVGFLGVGCASCGSLILSSIFGLSTTLSFLGILPFKGLEFGILGVFFLLFSIYLIAKKIQNPTVCKVN